VTENTQNLGIDWSKINIVPVVDTAKRWVPGECLLVISDRSLGMLVKVSYDGTVEFGLNYTPSEAARTFWESISNQVGLESARKVCEAHGYIVERKART
jgi:hypothetical protein